MGDHHSGATCGALTVLHVAPNCAKRAVTGALADRHKGSPSVLRNTSRRKVAMAFLADLDGATT